MIYRKAQTPWFGFSLLSFFLFLTGFQSAQAAAGPPTKVVLTVGAVSEREGVLYVALDQGFFRKHGVDLTLVQVRSGPIGIAALSSGESQLNWGSVSAANLGAIAEGADLVFVASFINKLTGNFVSNPRIKSPPELKGKRRHQQPGWRRMDLYDAYPGLLGPRTGAGQDSVQGIG